MNIDDSGEFGRRLVALAEIFDVKLSPARAALYFEALRDIGFEPIASSLNHAAKTCVFFPKPAELRTFALGNTEDQTETAWLLLRQAMKAAGAYASLALEDAALGETVLAMFGSWPSACVEEFTPEMWSAKRKEFGRVYRVMRGRNLRGARYLPGISETQNAGRRDYLKFVPVHRIGADDVTALTPDQAEKAREIMAARAGFSRLDASTVLPAIKGMTA